MLNDHLRLKTSYGLGADPIDRAALPTGYVQSALLPAFSQISLGREPEESTSEQMIHQAHHAFGKNAWKICNDALPGQLPVDKYEQLIITL